MYTHTHTYTRTPAYTRRSARRICQLAAARRINALGLELPMMYVMYRTSEES